jgi:hypothetical protein
MRIVDLAQFFCMIDDALLYMPVETKATIELMRICNHDPKSLLICKQLRHGRLEMVTYPDALNVRYFPPGASDSTAHFSVAPERDSTEIIRDKLRKIIILDAQSEPTTASMSLDLLRPERPLQ